ncbi:MAG: hypothetical protein PHR22_01250 [Candidatus Omnitrophica bacterium]|nr:hypothetical protein [Candidatus Omnitrophota bacterium]
MSRFIEFERTAQPTLLYPTTNDINLEGKDFLDFRWQTGDRGQTDHYELRLYNGYDTTVSGLILKVDVYTSPARIQAATFKEGGVYTWSLRQILRSGRRGDYSYSSFRVIKK